MSNYLQPQAVDGPISNEQNTGPSHQTGTSGRGDRGGGQNTLSISTTFHPEADLDQSPPNVVINASDNVFFYVHYHRLLSASKNRFDGRLINNGMEPSALNPQIITVPEDANTLNVVLHTVYGMSSSAYNPTFQTIAAAIDALKRYGCALQTYLARGSPLFAVFLGQAPLQPLEAYTIAAENGLHDLAVAVSPHLLSCQLTTCPDDFAARMGGIYFKRIYTLQEVRMQALKQMIFPPPYPHGPTGSCGFADQRALNRAWAMASAQLAWDARADMSPSAIQAMLGSLEQQLSCPECQEALMTRVREVIVQWSTLDRSIP